MKPQTRVKNLIAMIFLSLLLIPAFEGRASYDPLLENGAYVTPVQNVEEGASTFESSESEAAIPSGSLAFETQALSQATQSGPIAPSSELDASDIIPVSTSNPDPVTVSPEPWMAQITPTTRGAVMNYNTSWAGWAGGGFSFDAQGSLDLSGTSQLTVGLKGNIDTIKFEIVDVFDQKSSVHLSGIVSNQEQVWTIDTALFSGVDLSQARLLYFIVEGTNEVGQLEINLLPVPEGPLAPNPALTLNEVTYLPELLSMNGNPLPQPTVVAPAGANTTAAETSQGLRLNYQNGNEGWSGGGLTFDDFSTPSVETVDVSAYAELVFGFRSTAETVKLEVIDEWNQKSVVYLEGIASDEIQFWSIPTALFTGIDLTKVRIMYFIFEGAFESGVFDVIYQTPTKGITLSLNPTEDGLLSDPTELPANQAMVVAPPEASVSSSLTSRGLHMDYQLGSATWGGGGLSFDDFSTPAIETVDVSGYGNFVFGVQGDAEKVKLEFIDIHDNKRALYLEGILANQEQLFKIPTSSLQGLDLTKLRMIFVILEGQNQSGSLEFNHVPENFSAWTTTPSDTRFGYHVSGGLLEMIDFRTAETWVVHNQAGANFQNVDMLLDGKYLRYEVVGESDTRIFSPDYYSNTYPLTGVLIPSASNPDYWFIDSYSYLGASGLYQERLAVVNLFTEEETELVNAFHGVGYRDAFNVTYDVSPDGAYVIYERGGGYSQWGALPGDYTIVVQSLSDPNVKTEITHHQVNFPMQSITWFAGYAEIVAIVEGVSVTYHVDLLTLQVTQV